MGFGAGSRFYTSAPDDESAAQLIRDAVDRGIRFVETGANYGPEGLSEKVIGLAMTTHREGTFLETKVDELGDETVTRSDDEGDDAEGDDNGAEAQRGDGSPFTGMFAGFRREAAR